MERSPDNKPRMRVSDFTTLSEYSDLCFGRPAMDQPGAVMTTKAQKIHKVAIANAPQVMERALEGSGLTYDEVDYVIPHQTSKRAIEVGGKIIGDYFGVQPKMYKMLKQKVFKKGEKIMLLVFASGLVVGVVIFTMDDLVDKYGSSS
jgi:3-oxoacyl-[acyl-carrier-protein] synthase III